MKKKNNHWAALIALALFVLALSGCKSTTFNHTFADGTKIKVTDRRAFMRTEVEFAGSVSTNGTKEVTLKAKSDANTEALKAVAAGAAEGAVKALTKPVVP